MGLLTRLAAVPMVADMIGALAIIKLPILWATRLCSRARAAGGLRLQVRLDIAQLCGSVFLLLVGAGRYFLDARLNRTTAANIAPC